MADRQTYPMISAKSWWQIRNQFIKTIPSVVNVSYLKSLLSLNTDQSARNIISPLRQMHIIDSDGKPLPRATDWRSDIKYAEVCSTIISEIYPQELLDLFPDAQVDNAAAKTWFMDTCALGANAAEKIVSTFSLLKDGHVKTDSDISKSMSASKRSKPTKLENRDSSKNLYPHNDAISTPPSINTPAEGDTSSSTPSVHIDMQIHISPDATPDQIDSIFASMAKHLYGRK